MAKLTKDNMFKKTATKAETLLDKTTRAAREILDDEAEKRATKTARLRQARKEREAATPAAPKSGKASASAKRRSKTD